MTIDDIYEQNRLDSLQEGNVGRTSKAVNHQKLINRWSTMLQHFAESLYKRDPESPGHAKQSLPLPDHRRKSLWHQNWLVFTVFEWLQNCIGMTSRASDFSKAAGLTLRTSKNTDWIWILCGSVCSVLTWRTMTVQYIMCVYSNPKKIEKLDIWK